MHIEECTQNGSRAPAYLWSRAADPTTPRPAGVFDPALLKAGLRFKGARQTVVDAFEIAYLSALMARNDGDITRPAQEAGPTRYHLRELLERHGLKVGDAEQARAEPRVGW
jgi:DNA-binding NtrC family response regulator